MKTRAVLLTVLLVVLCCLGIAYAEEEITLTTYYPAPYGDYDELIATSLGVDDPSTNGAGQVFITTNPGELIVEGNVGIGTTSPGTKLEVAGQVKITGGSPGANKVLTSDALGLASWETPSGVPAGVIVMWSGTLANIPSGWRICDGGSGTPDLRDRFIYGAPPGQNPGATGGSTSHSHGFGNREVGFGPVGGTAPYAGDWYRIGISNQGLGMHIIEPAETRSNYFHRYQIGTWPSGAPFLQTVTGSATEASTSCPPYYKLAFIMKL